MIHNYLFLSIILFCLGIVGVISRRNVFTVFMSIESREEFFDFIPNMSSAYTGWFALHEWVGLAAQKIRMEFKKNP